MTYLAQVKQKRVFITKNLIALIGESTIPVLITRPTLAIKLRGKSGVLYKAAVTTGIVLAVVSNAQGRNMGASLLVVGKSPKAIRYIFSRSRVAERK